MREKVKTYRTNVSLAYERITSQIKPTKKELERNRWETRYEKL